jgi:hypothetical protein
MSLEMVLVGVLRVLTPLGPRYIRPSLTQRIHLIWIFRHFHVLPWQVLTAGQRKFMDNLFLQPRFVSPTQANGVDAPILGTLERRQPLGSPLDGEPTPSHQIGADAVARFAPASYNPQRRP